MSRSWLRNKTIDRSSNFWFFLLVGFCMLLFGYGIAAKDTPLFGVLPFVVLVLMLLIYKVESLMWLFVFFTPLSFQLSELMPQLSVDISLPSEPIIIGLLLAFVLMYARGSRIDQSIVKHPIAIAIYAQFAWILITSVSSSLPVVSFKYLFMRIWFIVPCFFMMAQLFKSGTEKIEKFIWIYVVGMSFTIAYTLIRHHFEFGLDDQQAANYVMSPLFRDHTSYGAILALFIPFLLLFTFSKNYSSRFRSVAGGFLVLFFIALVFSYTRAAWLSLVASFGVWGIMKLKIRFKSIAITAVAIFLVIFSFQDTILQVLESNSQDSSDNLTEHITSMTNISTDASNLERINRWISAIELFKERPMLGWGPGTYAMKYSPYQLARNRTIISTNSGDGGNAHSEYLGPLAEQGILGMILIIIVFATIATVGIQAYSASNNKRYRGLLMASVTALISYFTHGFLNNFLDTDKASVPFWGFAAIIVVLSVQIKKENSKKSVCEALMSDDIENE